jgi:hypothetical protein
MQPQSFGNSIPFSMDGDGFPGTSGATISFGHRTSMFHRRSRRMWLPCGAFLPPPRMVPRDLTWKLARTIDARDGQKRMSDPGVDVVPDQSSRDIRNTIPRGVAGGNPLPTPLVVLSPDPAAISGGGGAGVELVGVCPLNRRGVIDEFTPIAIDAAGRAFPPGELPPSVLIVWRILSGGKAVYQVWSQSGRYGQVQPRAIYQIPPGSSFAVDFMVFADPLNLVSRVGAHVSYRFLPMSAGQVVQTL